MEWRVARGESMTISLRGAQDMWAPGSSDGTCSDRSWSMAGHGLEKGWWDDPPYHVPVFVLSHHSRPSIQMEGNTTFHFVTTGISEALDQAREAAQGTDVRIGGGVNTIQQYLRAGLIDELHIAIAPVLLGGGERLFDGRTCLPWDTNACSSWDRKRLPMWCSGTRRSDARRSIQADATSRRRTASPRPVRSGVEGRTANEPQQLRLLRLVHCGVLPARPLRLLTKRGGRGRSVGRNGCVSLGATIGAVAARSL